MIGGPDERGAVLAAAARGGASGWSSGTWWALDLSARPLLAAVVRARGDLHRGSSDLAHRVAEQPPAALVDLLRRRAGSRFAPAVIGVRGALTDVVVHTGDICRPLGLPHAPDPDSVRAPGRSAT